MSTHESGEQTTEGTAKKLQLAKSTAKIAIAAQGSFRAAEETARLTLSATADAIVDLRDELYRLGKPHLQVWTYEYAATNRDGSEEDKKFDPETQNPTLIFGTFHSLLSDSRLYPYAPLSVNDLTSDDIMEAYLELENEALGRRFIVPISAITHLEAIRQ